MTLFKANLVFYAKYLLYFQTAGHTLAGAGSVGGMSVLDVFWHEIANQDVLVRYV